MHGRRDADCVASSRSPEVNKDGDDDDDSDYSVDAVSTDDEAISGEEEDKDMSDSEGDTDGDDAEGDDDDAPEESQPAAPIARRGRAKAASGVKATAKGGEPTHLAPKTRDHIPVKRIMAATEPHAVDGGGAIHVNVPCGFSVSSTSSPCTSTPMFTETATMAAAQLVCETIKGCNMDAMTKLEGLVRAWM
ncbi:unnamed protein product [Closterium sp. NIES-64]|nr:unnamed protein product [Closterium sp. NIES-64]